MSEREMEATLSPEMQSIRKSIQYITSKQNPNGGWPQFAIDGAKSSAAYTCHVLLMLHELNLHRSHIAKKGVDFLKTQIVYDKEGRPFLRGKEIAWVFPSKPNLDETLLVLAALKLSEVKDIHEEKLKNALSYCLNWYKEELDEEPIGVFAFYMLGLLMDWFHVPESEWDQLKDCHTKIWDEENFDFQRKVHDYYSDLAKMVLGLHCFPNSPFDEVIERLINVFITNKIQEGDCSYWSSEIVTKEFNVGHRPFFTTRWVALALLERANLLTPQQPVVKETLSKCCKWLIAQQSKEDGSWRDPEDEFVGLGFMSYTISAIWKYHCMCFPEAVPLLEETLQHDLNRLQIILPRCFKTGEQCKREDIRPKNNLIAVLMPFSKELNQVYMLGIEEPLVTEGFNVWRSDKKFTSTDIMCEVCKTIQESALVISDLTDDRPNVFYEIGLAHGLGKEVIMLAQDITKCPFDISGLGIIEYSNDNLLALRENLVRAVKRRLATCEGPK